MNELWGLITIQAQIDHGQLLTFSAARHPLLVVPCWSSHVSHGLINPPHVCMHIDIEHANMRKCFYADAYIYLYIHLASWIVGIVQGIVFTDTSFTYFISFSFVDMVSCSLVVPGHLFLLFDA